MTESDTVKRQRVYYVKIPIGFSYLLSPTQERFLIHMVDFDYLKRYGNDINWSKAEYMKRMGLTEYAFDRAAKKLVQMGLIDKSVNEAGNRVYYSLNKPVYDRLGVILSSTRNVNRLISFCETKFMKENRDIMSITDEELEELELHH
ncbi:hypothetical protein D0T87_02295 [Bacteroides sp. 51]|nr:hypothetical protein [Bacteroides sp. 51]